jgi:putative membrane protein
MAMMFDYGDHMGGWNWAFMSVSMVIFWGLLIIGIMLLVRYFGASGPARAGSPTSRATAEELLAERFARGEIDEQEYRQRLDVLRSGTSSPV